jgi:4-hydroxybenzoate polyprenyltransferase
LHKKIILPFFINYIENLNRNWIKALLYLFVLFFLRVYFENTFFPLEINRFVFAHEMAFFFWCFFLILMLFCLVTKEKLDRLFSASSVIISLVIVAPFLDRFIFSRIQPYDYTSPENFRMNFIYFFLKSNNVGKGLIIELALLIVFIAIYTFYKTRSFFKMLITVALTYTGIQLIAAPKLYLPVPEFAGLVPMIPSFAAAERLLYFLFYFLCALLLVVLIFFLRNRNLIISLLRNTRPLRTLNFILLTVAGLVVAQKLSFSYPDWIYALLALLGVFFLWQCSVIINDVFDVRIDRANLKKRPLVLRFIQPRDYLRLGLILGLLGIILSLLIGRVVLLCSLFFFLLAILYSVPPFRLRRGLLAYPIIGLGSALSFMIGYSSGTFLLRVGNLPLASKSIFYVFAVLTIGSVTKDAQDYEGDRQMGIKNFFTIVKRERARWIISLLLFLGFLSPLFFIFNYIDILFFLVMGTAAAVLFYKRMSYPLTMLFYLMAATYFLLRL